MIKTNVKTFSKYVFFYYLYLIYMYTCIYSFTCVYISIYLSIYLPIYLTYNWHIVYKQDITDSCLT